MAASCFHFLLILLSLSHLRSLNSAPITRIGRLMHGPDRVLPPADNILNPEHSFRISEKRVFGSQVTRETGLEEEMILKGRMGVEVNDYSGSGANNRHTPRSQFGRCVDC